MHNYDTENQFGLYAFLEGSTRRSGGNTWYVDSNSGNKANTSGSGQGESWANPFSTINYAVSQCTNQGGDVILVAKNHAETIQDTSDLNESGTVTDELCIDKSELTIIGMGRGTSRPTITLGDATDATVEIRAANVTIKNFIIASNLADIAAGITVANSVDGTLIENVEFRDGGSNTLELVLGVSLSANADDVTIRGCQFYNTDGGGNNAAIYTAGTITRLKIHDNLCRGDWANPVLDLDAGNATDVDIRDNVINNIDASAGLVIGLNSSGTGAIYDNLIHTGLPTAAPITATGCLIGRNIITFDEGSTGGLTSLHPATGRVSKSYTNWTDAKHTLFDIVGGPVIVTGLIGVVTATIKSVSIDINLDLTPTAPGVDVVLGTVLVIDGDAIGTTYTMNATFGGALVVTTNGGLEHAGDKFIAPIGAITMECSGGGGGEDAGGTIQWCLSYIALTPEAHVIAAPTD